MKNPITIREAITEQETAAFWKQLCARHEREAFPGADDSTLPSGQQGCRLLLCRNGRDIGFALAELRTDGSCRIMEYGIGLEFQDRETAGECAGVLLDWAKEHGAQYAELNYGGSEKRRRFWEGIGFVENGADERKEPLLLFAMEDLPVTMELLADPEDGQLHRLENGFKKSIGEEALTEEEYIRLQQAVRQGRITFLIARRGRRAVGMCSIARYYSTFACADTGVYEDFYMEPAFRGKGIARKLAQAAQAWCRENGLASVTVCCAPCDEAMYKSLGFDTVLGTSLAHTES